MQFFVRDNLLHSVVTMRSQDIILGFTYDVFTFSMVANAVRLLLNERGIKTELGNLHVNVGSLHIYETHFEKADDWLNSFDRDLSIEKSVKEIMKAQSYHQLIEFLRIAADK
jgi:thymidylate synthase